MKKVIGLIFILVLACIVAAALNISAQLSVSLSQTTFLNTGGAWVISMALLFSSVGMTIPLWNRALHLMS